MIRSSISSPMQAKAKRRQSDAKWRASVATCYDALKYVVPNMKTLKKRKISKALILQESEQHIKELEAAVHHLLQVESKRKNKTILWRDGPQWSLCTLDKLRLDFSEKQQRVFHMAAHGRRCYNLLQDIKEEVFAMEADPSHLAVLQENTQAANRNSSSLIDKPEETDSTTDNCKNAKVQAPGCKISLILSGLAQTSKRSKPMLIKQPIHNDSASSNVDTEAVDTSNRLKALFTSITSRKQPQTSASIVVATHTSGKGSNNSLVTLKLLRQMQSPEPRVSLSVNQPEPQNVTQLQSFPPAPSSSLSYSLPLLIPSPGAQCKLKPIETKVTDLRPREKNQTMHSLRQGASNGNSSNGFQSCTASLDTNQKDGTPGRLLKFGGQRLKIRIDNVDTNFFIVSNINQSIAPAVEKASVEQSEERTCMKLPLKMTRRETIQEENECEKMQNKLTGIKEIPKFNRDGKVGSSVMTSAETGSSYTPQHCTAREVLEPDQDVSCYDNENIQEHKLGFGGFKVISVQSNPHTPVQQLKTLGAVESKPESLKVYTPFQEKNRDPLLSSLLTPKSDEGTSLFFRDENDMIIKRKPRPGTARKKLNFGPCHSSTPNKQFSNSRISGVFTPVKLPDDFGFVPDIDNAPMDSLVSSWKIMDSPYFDHQAVSQNYFEPTLDLDDSLICFETIDSMDLDDDEDVQDDNKRNRKHKVPTKRNKDTTDVGTLKRKASLSSPEMSFRHNPKCRKTLDQFYDVPRDSSYSLQTSTATKVGSDDLEESHVVPDFEFCYKKFDSFERKSKPSLNVSLFNKSKCADLNDSQNLEDSCHVVPDLENKRIMHTLRFEDLEEIDYNDVEKIRSKVEFEDFEEFLNCDQPECEGQRQPCSSSSYSCLPYNSTKITVLNQQSTVTTLTSPAFSSAGIASSVAQKWSQLPCLKKVATVTSTATKGQHSDKGTYKSYAHQEHHGMKDLGNIHGFQSPSNRKDTQAYDSNDSLQHFMISRSSEVWLPGELSEDLQDLEVQPLVDYNYDYNFDFH